MSQEEYNEAMKNANPEDVKNAMKAMDNMLDSNVFDEVLYILYVLMIVCMYGDHNGTLHSLFLLCSISRMMKNWKLPDSRCSPTWISTPT